MPIKSCIVSTGGGIVERNDNWSMMSHAIIIWLHGDTPLLARRVVADGRASRPLLKDDPQACTHTSLHLSFGDVICQHSRTCCRIHHAVSS